MTPIQPNLDSRPVPGTPGTGFVPKTEDAVSIGIFDTVPGVPSDSRFFPGTPKTSTKSMITTFPTIPTPKGVCRSVLRERPYTLK